jgi:hypothetical protein
VVDTRSRVDTVASLRGSVLRPDDDPEQPPSTTAIAASTVAVFFIGANTSPTNHRFPAQIALIGSGYANDSRRVGHLGLCWDSSSVPAVESQPDAGGTGMETRTLTTTVAVRDPLFSPEEQAALVGFLAGYSGPTREAYALDLRQYVAWCTEHQVRLFGARRADIEAFGRHLELSVERGRRSPGGCARSRAFTATPKKKE